MVRERRRGIAEAMRQRILRGLQTGALVPGARLPGVRQVGTEFDVDPRVVALAYQDLAEDGLVEVRARSGAFVSNVAGAAGSHRDPPASWLAQLVSEGVLRGVPAAALTRWVSAAVSTRRLNAVVIAGVLDQAEGLARELRDDYGVSARGILLDEVRRGEQLPRALGRAHFLLTTLASQVPVQRVAERLGRPLVVVSVRPDLLSLEWQSLMRRTVYVVVADPAFQKVVREFVGGSAGAHNVRTLVAGKDDVASIPPDAPTYVTESARIRLGRTRLPGRLLAPARLLSDDSVREVARLVVDLNLAASSESGPGRRRGSSAAR